MAPKQFRMAEVRKHKTTDSLWFVINDAVYDVTAFTEEHPGGAEALLENAGAEATQAFEDVGHSDDAREQMKKFKIGVLHPDDIICKPSHFKCTDGVKIAGAVLVIGLVIGFVLKRYVLA